jgi:hypothetical protein
MPTTIQAIIPNAAIDAVLQNFGGLGGPPAILIDSFKVGEGGYEITASGNVPRDPTEPGATGTRGPFLTDLDATQNPADYPGATGTFQKALAPGDFAYDAGTRTLSVTCLLDFGEFNDDGFGNPPEIYEIGLFAGTLLVAYGTMTQQVKTPGVQIPNIVRITATGA